MTQISVLSVLTKLDHELTPARLLAERLADADSFIDLPTGAALISHRPKIGTEAYACVIFPGVAPEVLEQYEEVQRSIGNVAFEIPAIYRNVLLRLNGAWIFQLSLYGLPPSMCRNPPLLDRSAHQPLDLGTANMHWRHSYAADPSLFHFGSGPYSPEENIAYFLHADGRVSALLRGGHEVLCWASIEIFLGAEVPRAESQYEDFESRMGDIKIPPTPKSRRGAKARQR